MTHSFVQRIGVYTETINVAKRRWDSTLTKQMHQRMDALWVVDVKIPKHSVVGHICLWVSFMGAIHGGKLDRVPNKEYWKIVENKVLNTFLSIKLGRPATDITNCIAGTFLSTDR